VPFATDVIIVCVLFNRVTIVFVACSCQTGCGDNPIPANNGFNVLVVVMWVVVVEPVVLLALSFSS
jgi:hypothetical protein